MDPTDFCMPHDSNMLVLQYIIIALWAETPNDIGRFPGGAIKPSIPLVGKIAAGAPITAIEHQQQKLPFDPSYFGNHSCFALRIQGDSMIDAHIMDGDIAIIQQQSRAKNKQIVAAMVVDLLPEATLKIFCRKKEEINLVAANDLYPPLVFKGKEQKTVQILGVLVGVIRKNTY